MSRRVFKTLFILVLACGGAALAAWQHFEDTVDGPIQFAESSFSVKQGDTLGSVAARLAQQKVISHPLYLKLLARKEGVGNYIRQGDYRTDNVRSIRDFLNRIVSGEGIVELRVTFIEGWTFKQMRAALKEANGIVVETAELSDEELMAKLGRSGTHPEGQFFPDTYLFNKGETDLTIFKRAMLAMDKQLTAAWESRTESVLVKDPYELLILASIIEKETQVRDEQPTIAGVFYNRIKIGMRLQTDPTVIYGIGDAYDGDITRAHLRTDTPYNTYTRDGLPPTPICLPGKDSLHAAANPAATPAYFFVAKGGGRHHFSETLKEHNQAVQKYILSKPEQ